MFYNGGPMGFVSEDVIILANLSIPEGQLCCKGSYLEWAAVHLFREIMAESCMADFLTRFHTFSFALYIQKKTYNCHPGKIHKLCWTVVLSMLGFS